MAASMCKCFHRPMLILRCFRRARSSGPHLSAGHQQKKYLKKFLQGTKKSIQLHQMGQKPEAKERSVISLLQNIPGPQARPSRRQVVLNTMFIRQITDIMTTGSISQELAGHGIQILGVEINENFSKLEVRWAGTGTSKDIEIHQLLESCKGKLGNELTQLHLISKIPCIVFIRDMTYSHSQHLDKLFVNADYGEVETAHLNPALTETEEMHGEKEMKDQKLDSFEPFIPPMKMDVGRLDHEKIMRNVRFGIGAIKDKVKSSASSTSPPPHQVYSHQGYTDIKQYLKDRSTKIQATLKEQKKRSKADFAQEEIMQEDDESNYHEQEDYYENEEC